MEIKYLNLELLNPYANNARLNEKAVDKVASSIKTYGFNTVTAKGYLKRKGEKSSYKIGYCKNCSEEFVARSDTDQAFCSVSCQSKYNWKTGKIIPKNSNCKIDFICEQCNGIFVDFQSNNRRFCSKECFAEFNHGEKTLRKCLKCKCEFEMYVSALKTNATGNYCSRKCYEEALRGENFQELRRRNLGTAKWRKIRDSILKRMPICPVCFNKKDLNIHHIIPFRITEDDSEKNLIPLCRSCHGKFESLTRFCELAKIPWDYFYIFMKSYYLERIMLIASEIKERGKLINGIYKIEN